MRAPRLWLVRHAQVLAVPGVCYGQLDLPADRDATQRCAQALAAALPQSVVVRHSTLQRCELLAQSLQALRPDLTLKSDARLRELDFGRWEGQPWASLPGTELGAWAAQLATYSPGGGERLVDMLARVDAAMREAALLASATGGDVVWISHAGVARCVQWLQSERASAGHPPCSAHWPVQAPALASWAHYGLTSPDAAAPAH